MTQQQVVELIPALRAFARTFCSNPEDADDLVQETLTRALGSLDQFTEGTRLKSWLFTIMRNAFNTSYRKKAREMVGVPQPILDKLYVDGGQEWAARGLEVHAALHRLPLHYREAVVFVVIFGESYEEAARMCGCKVGTIKSRVNRARERLQEDFIEAEMHAANQSRRQSLSVSFK